MPSLSALNEQRCVFRWKWKLRTAFLLTCTALSCASALAGTSDDSSQQRSIAGQVINAISGSPIPRALVRLNQRAVLTDHEGRFEFKNAAPDAPPSSALNQSSPISLTVEKPGFFGSNGMQRFSDVLDLNPAAGENAAAITLRLYPEAIISGTVQGADGGPVSRGAVQLRKHAIVDGRKQWQIVFQSRLNAEGEFRFADLTPGDYSVVTELQGERIFTKNGQEGYLPEHYPPSLSGDDIASLHLSAGQTVSLQLAPKHERYYAVNGHVSGNNSGRFGRFQVQTGDKEILSIQSNFNPQTGNFRMMVPNGSYEISAIFSQLGGGGGGGLNGTGAIGTGMYGTAQVTVSGHDVEGVSITLQASTTIPVVVDMQQVASSSNNTFGDRININGQTASPLNMVNVQLVPVTFSGNQQPLWSRREKQDDQATLSIPNVTPGRYNAVIHAAGPWYVKSITCGSLNLALEPLTVAPSAGSDPIRIVLQNDVGRVKARILSNGQPAKGYFYLIPADPSATPLQQFSGMNSRTNSGSYTFPFLAPGNYLAVAYDRPHDLEYRNPEVLRQLSFVAKSITVPPNGETDVDVEVTQTTAGDQ